MKDYSPGRLQRIAREHVTLYEHRVQLGKAGNPNVRLHECEWYLETWKSILKKLDDECCYAAFTPQEVREIQDAVDSEEWE